MRTLIFLFYCTIFSTLVSHAQVGFSKTFLLPTTTSNIISSLVVDQDTIVCFGTLYDEATQKWGIFLAKFDSLCNFLQMTTDFDSIYQQSVNPFAKIISTSDGGYICVSTQGVGVKSAVYKFSHTGVLEWTHFYKQGQISNIGAFSVSEMLDGYLVVGWYGEIADHSVFTMKLTKAGNLAWFRTEAALIGYNDFTARMVKINDNRYLMSSGISPINSSLFDNGYWAKSRLVEVDSLGAVQWEWSNEQNQKESGVTALAVQNDTEVVYSTVQYVYLSPLTFEYHIILRKVNMVTGATVWRKQYTQATLSLNSVLTEIVPSPAGDGIDIIGIYQAGNSNGFVKKGWTIHANWDGDIIWQRRDTGYFDPELIVNEGELYALGHLSSGAIISGGFVLKSTPNYHNEAWLLKMSANGCLSATDCAPILTSSSTAPEGWSNGTARNWTISPNPTKGLSVLQHDPSAWGKEITITLSNAMGKPIKTVVVPFSTQAATAIDLTGWAAGLYFYRVVLDGLEVGAGKVVVE